MNQSPKPNLAYSWFVVIVLMIAYIFSFIDRFILSLLVEPIKRDMHFNDTQLSLLMGFSFALFYTILGLPIGRLADFANRKWIITVGIVTWSLMTAVCGLVKNFTQFFWARVGVGVGEAALSPPAYSLIADYFPKERLAAALSVYSMGIYLGGGLALLIGSLIIYIVGDTPTVVIPIFGEIFSWQLVFFYVGLPGVLVAGLMFFVREPMRRGANSITGEALRPLPFGEVMQYIRANGTAFGLLSVGFGFYTMTTYAASSWVPVFLSRTYQWKITDAGLAYGMMVTVFSTLGVVLGGLLADHWRRKGMQDAKVRLVFVSALLYLPCNILYTLMPTGEWAVAMLAPTCFVSSLPLGAGPAAIQEMMPNQMRATASALFLFILSMMGLGTGPTLVAVTTDYILQDTALIRYSLLSNACISLTAAAICFWFALKPFANSVEQVSIWEEQQQTKSA